MPIYEFLCADCLSFELILPMGTAPDVVACPTCRGDARRRITAPHISRTASSAFALIDAASRSAHEPAVVDSKKPGVRTGQTPRYTSNPLHQKLPRP
ncbi:zinc ribbon domain-containing protein [Cryobacterium sp. TMT2-18-3]|uniref:FmdB family zinc ribbon protein n=1 Tax=unclassified Cryobacterium TaxID=2649013 RepID=UPI00106BEFBA|nr:MULTISPECIES: zinc ribbon domain-containing protein [unclassified Cryobacterium]TFC26787.1 zinc ribbon domain-containing protein [Cryobacterium sp. TMT2-18-2]TFC36266.1 zinc ribbon domain-containing protein [Cryobacterium sp. TMT2-42-4]TFC68783.1 zinc ribbon domain-containing protein [Cryobacterium sp. TMT2-18-3]